MKRNDRYEDFARIEARAQQAQEAHDRIAASMEAQMAEPVTERELLIEAFNEGENIRLLKIIGLQKRALTWAIPLAGGAGFWMGAYAMWLVKR